MKTRQTMTISLPPAMLEAVQAASKAEHRTHSELVREALRGYLNGRYPVVSATKAELAAIAKGRAEIARGDFVTMEGLVDALAAANRKSSAKSARTTSR